MDIQEGDIVVRIYGEWLSLKLNDMGKVDGFSGSNTTVISIHVIGTPMSEYSDSSNLRKARGLEIDLFIQGVKNIPESLKSLKI